MGASAQEYENWRKTLPKRSGLEHRYNVEKVNDPEGKHAECRYFVLDPLHDLYAYDALSHYAYAVRNVYPELSRDLYDLLDSLPLEENYDEPSQPIRD